MTEGEPDRNKGPFDPQDSPEGDLWLSRLVPDFN